MASSFTPFPFLPPELRQQIWREALEDESDKYIILRRREAKSYMHQLLPQISPFLVLTRESRALAMASYPTVLDMTSDNRYVTERRRGSLRVDLDRVVFVWFWGSPPSKWSVKDLKAQYTGWYRKAPKMLKLQREQLNSSVRRILDVDLGRSFSPDRDRDQYPDSNRYTSDCEVRHKKMYPKLVFKGYVAPNKDDCLTQEGNLLPPSIIMQNLIDKMGRNPRSVHYRYTYRPGTWPDCAAGLPTLGPSEDSE
ncbi:hypothetical protein F4820DRAFT_316742 [Hypoxylon rubiginosum]|uniref:Uncharacterized protein n=1 Tax=Hypoxylon rubiginosum TaxID=110542 RepID=A0ACB9ZGM5_9PEZI|nr:hypothetical protein F4820DRAFT_316742 [Hypoxylon rubiginosum]